MIKIQGDQSRVQIITEGKKLEWRNSVSVRRKFHDCITPYLNAIFKYANQSLQQKYFENLEKLLNGDKSALDDWLQTIIELVNSTYDQIKKEFNIQFPDVEQQTSMTVMTDEFEDLFKLSLACKLAVFVIHYHKPHELVVNPSYVLDYLVRKFVRKETVDKLIKFISTSITNSFYSRESMWTYLKDVLGITPENVIQQTLNSFFRSMITLYDPRQQNNIMSYLMGFVNQAMYYLFTDTYDKNIQYVNLMKLKYIKNHNLITEQALMSLFDKISELIKSLFPDHIKPDDTRYDIATKTYKVKPYSFLQKGIVVNPVTKYVTFPLMQKLFKADYYYFTEYRNLRLIEIYVSLVVENVLELKYLAKLIRSIVVDKAKRKIKLNRVKLKELEEQNYPLRDLLSQKKFFSNIVSELKTYKYYDPLLHDFYVVDIDLLLDDLKQFYYMLMINPGKLQSLLSDIIVWYNRPEVFQPKSIEALAVF